MAWMLPKGMAKRDLRDGLVDVDGDVDVWRWVVARPRELHLRLYLHDGAINTGWSKSPCRVGGWNSIVSGKW